jgi:toxin secretion/phage lysis holin
MKMSDKLSVLTIKGSVAVIFAGIAAIFGRWDGLLTALICMVVADYLTGVIAAAIAGKLDSSIGLKGILKKISIFVAIAIAAIADYVTGLHGNPLRTAACLFYIGNEGVSIVENLGRTGLPIPDALKKLFARLKSENDSKTDGEKKDPPDAQAPLNPG